MRTTGRICAGCFLAARLRSRSWLPVAFLLTALWLASRVSAQEASTEAATEQPAVSADALLPQLNELTTSAQTEDDYSGVIAMCEQLLAAKATDAQQKYAHDTAAWAFNRRGQLKADTQPAEALADFDAALQHSPSAWRARYNRAISLAQAGQLEQAQADLDKVIQAQPGNFKASFNRGEVKFARGDVAGAIPDYDAALRLDPGSAAAYSARGFARFRLGQYPAALRDFDQSLAINPQDAATLVNRGDALAESGQYGKATQDYRLAIEIEPRSSRAHLSWSWLMATCPNAQYRNAESALAYARFATKEIGSDDYHYLDVLAASLASAGQFDEARQVQAKALALAPDGDKPALQQRLDQYAANQPFRAPQPAR